MVTVPDQATLQAQCLAFLRSRFTNRDTGTESFLGKIARAWSMMLLGLQQSVQNADRDSPPSQNSSSAALDLWASVLGLSNGAGGFGRKGANPASGGLGLCTGTNGTVFTAGSALTAPDGTTILQLVSLVTIFGSPPGSGSIQGSFSAITAGSAGNLPAGTVLTWTSPPAGADQTVTLTTGLTGGQDTETDAQLLARIFDRLQNPPKGGTAADYRAWAQSIVGVSRAYVYPRRGGLGSVHVFITSAGSGAARQPSSTVQANVDAFINSVKPVNVDGYLSLTGDYSTRLIIRVRVVPSLSNTFDWSDGGTALVVDTSGYSSGPPATLRFTGLAPQSLKDAITAAISAGTAQTTGPRIQVGATNGPSVPVPARCVNYSDGGGKTTVTLQTTLPTGWVAPTGADVVYASGPVQVPVATDILSYVDRLGPSKQSGYADPNDFWEDTAAVFRIAEIALDTVDASNGNVKLLVNLVSGGVTIDPGSGPAAVDVQAKDISIQPQVLVAKYIFVTD